MNPHAADPTPSSLEPAQFLQLVLDTIPQKVFWKDIHSVYLGCNRLFAKDAGLSSPDEIIGMTDFELPWTPEEAAFYRSCDRRVMDRNVPEIGIVEPQRNSDGESTFLETNKVPLCDKDGRVIGILGSYHDITRIKEAESTLRRAHDLLEQRVKDRTRELRYLADHDALTGLPNRDYFMSQLEDIIAEGVPYGVLFIDVDRFKAVNDSLGHACGDQLLAQVARTLESQVRDTDVVGRFGGDEFTILLRNIAHVSHVVDLNRRIQNRLANTIELKDAQLVVSVSIGFLTDFDGKYSSAGDVLRNADIAMYEAKRAGKACHRHFSDDMLQRVSENLALENQIRHGLSSGEFFNAYQPIVDLESNRLKGFEVLVRWRNSQNRILLPAEFLTIAEETGLIVDIGEEVILQAGSDLQCWKEQYPEATRDLSVSVNLSITQLLAEDFMVFLQAAMTKHKLEPKDINIEITESMILDKQSDVLQVLESLSSNGHQLMLDDFGTGYSSLSYLHHFPVNTLKIDRSFVSNIDENPNSHAIVKTVVVLAQCLNMEVIAEGVETEIEEQCLTKMGCQLMQGYRFAKPMSLEDSHDYLKNEINAKQLPASPPLLSEQS